ncbi:hypothetical protein BGX38DRAFT_1249757 [Terfezia claveryi]|nr:hypothetical protein BGX38DRAFT_1249757 [Terfezia claveryi]
MPAHQSMKLYSGVSWALSTGAKDVKIINDWPNPHGVLANQDKVPSAIAYDQEGNVSKWGYKVGINDTNYFRWIKIMLDPSNKYFNETPHIKEMVTRMNAMRLSAEDVVTAYLACLWKYTIEHLKRKKGGDFEELYTLKVVLTVPAVWSPLAKDRTLRAAKRAGMPVGSQLVTEPEAAALALLKQKSDENTVKVGDGFVVCDAGGGTVDLISYKVESLKPLKIRECVIGDGGLCGSVFLDLEFERHIRTLVGRDVYAKIKQKDINKMFREFEYGIKRSFTQDDTAPLTVDLKGAGDSPEIGIEDDTIKIEFYGISFADPFDSSNPNHHQSDKYWDAAKQVWRASNQMRWLLKRGVKKLCSLTFSIPYGEIRKEPTYVSAGRTWCDVSYSRDILCGGANLEYRVSYNGQLLKSVEAEYIDDFQF